MTRLRLAFLTAIAVLALTAVASATASALEYKIEGSGVTGKTALENINETGTKNKLKGTPFGVTVQIQCSHREGENLAIDTLGSSEVKLKFSSCTVEKPANCSVEEPIVTTVVGALGEAGGGLVNEFSPVSGTTFTEITLLGSSCSLKGKPFKVEGKQACELPAGAVEAVEHGLACNASGSALTAGGKKAEFESSEAKLSLAGANEGKKWSA